MAKKPLLDIQPLTRARWKDLEKLFNGPGGSQVRGCWCMYYRRSGNTPKPPGQHDVRGAQQVRR